MIPMASIAKNVTAEQTINANEGDAHWLCLTKSIAATQNSFFCSVFAKFCFKKFLL